MSDPTPRSRYLLEFSVVLAVIAILGAFFLDALYDIQEQAERTVMEATVRNMNSGVRMEAAMRTMHGKEASIAELPGVNPIQFLENPPAGYSGMCSKELVPGGWCFDEATHEIVYQPRVARALRYLESPRPGLRWRVGSVGEIAGRPGGGAVSVGAIGVFSTTSFVWR